PKPAPPVAAKPPEPKPAPPVAAKPPEPKPEPPVAAKPPEPKPEPPVAAKPPEPKPAPPVAAKPPADLVEPPPRPKEKPEPPSRTGKSEPKPEPRKYDPTQFQALLRNLAAQQAAPAPDAPPQKPRAASARASSQPKAPLASQLTANELDMVRHQIAQCWNVPAGARDARDLVVEIRVAVDPDGAVRQATIVDQGRLSDPFFRAAAESARRAFFNPQCRPLHLPPGKYAIWKDLVVDFSPKDML
ncbi:MAG: energy transducer TonB, partial [Alphaproteobacteria bacterium]|nr:energy transducer TonB [Alphaproteobacteria bacterium]